MEKRLKTLAGQLGEGRNERLLRDVSCPGDWALMAALSRRESRCLLDDEELRCHCRLDSDYPWRVVLSQAPETAVTAAVLEAEPRTLPADAQEKLKTALAFRYPHTPATMEPSKQTATQRKGRIKDQEAAENAEEPKVLKRTWRKPGFLEEAGKDYGNAMHAAMQYIRFEDCGSISGVEKELDRLFLSGFLNMEQRKVIKPFKIASFFQTELGKKLLTGTEYVREFKFSILADAGEGLEGEQVLLQGVVDCALLEEDGITVIDFKTDRVTKATVEEACRRYRDQVDTYAEAMRRIYGMPVKAKCLYFFALEEFCQL